jgi:GNAT superfamily N-acetyltransferase
MNPIDITLRPGSVEDLDTVMAMFDEAIVWLVAQGRSAQWGSQPYSTEPRVVDFVRKMLEHGETSFAERNGKTLGVLVISPERIAYAPEAGEPEIYIHLLITSPEVRGQGVGSLLLEHARAETRRRGIGLLRVDCWAGGDRRLVRYYENAGFTPTVEVPVQDTSVQIFEQRMTTQ